MHCWGSGAPWISAAALGDFHRYVFCGVHDTTTAHITLVSRPALILELSHTILSDPPDRGRFALCVTDQPASKHVGAATPPYFLSQRVK